MSMKIKVMKRENDIIIEYSREKKPNDLRYKVLDFLVKRTEGKIFIYVDTNSKVKAMPIADIENILKASDLSYECEAVESSKRGVFGLKQMIKPNKKNKRLIEHIIVIEVPQGTDLNEIYYKFLCNYDYALGIGSDKPLGELTLRLKSSAIDVLFNKEILSNTVYDSIVIRRMRMDSPYNDLADFADNL